MATSKGKSIVCQVCGNETPFDERLCRHCGGIPLFANERETPKEKDDNYYNFLEEEINYLKQKMESLSIENEENKKNIQELEKDLFSQRAGLNLLLNEVEKKLKLDRATFFEMWEDSVKQHFRIMILKDNFLEKKLEMISQSSSENLPQFEDFILKVEESFYLLDIDEILKALKEALNLSQSNLPLIVFSGRFFFEMGRMDEAKSLIFSALKKGITSKEIFKLAAMISLFFGDFNQAKGFVEQYSKSGGEQFETFILRACIEANTGNWKEATRWSSLALKEEKNLFALLMLSFSLVMQKKYDQSKKIIEEELNLRPENKDIKHILHAIYLLGGDKVNAVSIRKSLKNERDYKICIQRERYFNTNKMLKFFRSFAPPIDKFLLELNVVDKV